MPAFYPRPMANPLPLTPPDSGSGYGYGCLPYSNAAYGQSHMSLNARREGAYDYQQSYLPPTLTPSSAAYSSYPQPSGYSSGNSLPPIHTYYEPIGAPTLPPLRINDRISFADDYHRCLQQEQQQQHASAREQQRQRQAAKDEKPTGGVSAKLDYDMERMTSFVVSVVPTIFHYHLQNEPSFRKWVHQVLSATRLPSATILLSLHFLNDRVVNHPTSFSTTDDQIYRLVAVSLILGSKFLDDNTFINRSWSDVTAIKVTELNRLEMQWLQLLEYRLHVDPAAHGGLNVWFDHWKTFESHSASRQSSVRHSPLESHAHRRERFSPYPSPYSATSARFADTPLSSRSSTFTPTSFTSGDPWSQSDRSAFDDFYKRQHRYPTLTEIDDVNRRLSEERSQQQSTLSYPYSSQAYYPTSTYNSPWSQSSWSGMHRHDCACSTCAYQAHCRPYPMVSSYTTQTVMG